MTAFTASSEVLLEVVILDLLAANVHESVSSWFICRLRLLAVHACFVHVATIVHHLPELLSTLLLAELDFSFVFFLEL